MTEPIPKPGGLMKEDLWLRVAGSARKWYAPVATEILGQCGLHALGDRQDEVSSKGLLISFPSALPPRRSVVGVNPLDLSALIFSPLIVRLNYIAQLSTTDLRANIDAKHCRLSHALGTLSILSVLMDSLISRMRVDGVDEICLPTKREVVAAFTYAALHDAFQGPFGHVLDLLREQLVGPLHEERRLDKTLFSLVTGCAIEFIKYQANNLPVAAHALCRVLSETVAKPNDISLEWLLIWLQQAAEDKEEALGTSDAKERRRQLGWLYELLEGPMDADRWDYLWRDTLHLGLLDEHASISRALREFKDEVFVRWDGSRSTLVISEGLSRSLGKDFFGLRKNLYGRVYENPEKRIIDGELVRCIYLCLLPPSVSQGFLFDKEYMNFLFNLIHVTDRDLLSILEDPPEQPSRLVLLQLVRELSTYPAAAVSWEGEINEEEFKLTGALLRRKWQDFRYQGVNPPTFGVIRTVGQSDKEFVSARLQKVREKIEAVDRFETVVAMGRSQVDALLLHCSILPIRLARLLQFERVLWALVCYRLRESPVVEKVVYSVSVAMARAAEDIAKGLPPAISMKDAERANVLPCTHHSLGYLSWLEAG
jgi:HD superfamily phosphohydrolase